MALELREGLLLPVCICGSIAWPSIGPRGQGAMENQCHQQVSVLRLACPPQTMLDGGEITPLWVRSDSSCILCSQEVELIDPVCLLFRGVVQSSASPRVAWHGSWSGRSICCVVDLQSEKSSKGLAQGFWFAYYCGSVVHMGTKGWEDLQKLTFIKALTLCTVWVRRMGYYG
jgi:hypothetical protein